jgi:Ca2+-binding RTX toxin-like protein
MPDRTANTMALDPGRSESMANVRSAILDVTSRGMDVMLKPHVESLDGTWRAEIAPTNPDLWFQNYKAMMLQYAQLAQETGVAMLCIGTEMKSMSGQTHKAKWVDLIGAVKQVYHGLVTYAATYDEVKTVAFWDKVDRIGVDAYVPLTGNNNPSVPELVDAWTKPRGSGWIHDLYGGLSVVDFYKSLSEQYGKPIIFTEIGFRSLDGTNKDPGLWANGGTLDEQEQKDCYEALFKVMTTYGGRWLDGAFLWSYHPFADPVAHGVQTTDFTTQGKPADAVIAAGYSSPAHVAGLSLSGGAAADKLDGGYHNDTLAGGTGNDTLWGGAGADRLDGGGGGDRMEGGSGDDTYSVDDLGDVVVEASASGGNDTVTTSVSFTLGAFLEALVAAGSAPLALTGNALANTIVGNAADNLISGAAGADAMAGGAGNDTYLVDDLGDSIADSSGLDRAIASVNYVLPTGVDNLSAAIGASPLALTGNGLANSLTGNTGKNLLKGEAGADRLAGGLGSDTLLGGTGRDAFVFDTRLNRTKNVDALKDFKVKDDTIYLDDAVFTKIGKGAVKPVKLKKDMFFLGKAAHDASDRIVYDKASGALFYDPDGTGHAAQIKFALLPKKLPVTYADFAVI